MNWHPLELGVGPPWALCAHHFPKPPPPLACLFSLRSLPFFGIREWLPWGQSSLCASSCPLLIQGFPCLASILPFVCGLFYMTGLPFLKSPWGVPPSETPASFMFKNHGPSSYKFLSWQKIIPKTIYNYSGHFRALLNSQNFSLFRLNLRILDLEPNELNRLLI